MTSIMPFPPRARKSAGIVQEGHQHLQQTSEMIHQHRLSLASQIRKFDARWASLFNLAPVLNKLTKGRQMPAEFRDNAQVLLDDVQHALRDAHSRKLPKIPEEGDSIIPGPPPPVPITTGRPRSLASWRRRQTVDSQAPSEKQSIVVRVRSKLKRKRAVKRKGSKKGPLSRFNPFRYKHPKPHPQEENITTGEPPPPTSTTVRHKSSRQTIRSGGSPRSSRKQKRSKSSKSSSNSRLRDFYSQNPAPPTMPRLVDPNWKPHLPPAPNFSPMKLDMSSIGRYSPTITKPLMYQRPPWPGVGIVDPDGPMGSVTPSSPQPYYLEVGERGEKERIGKQKRDKRDKRKSKISSRDDGLREREREREYKEEEDRQGSRRRHTHKHHRHSHRVRDADSSEDSRRDRDRDHYHRHRSSRDDYNDSRRREKEREREREMSEPRRTSTRRHYNDASRRKHGSKGSSTPPISPSYTYTTHHRHGYQPTVPQIVERSRFQENFSVIS
ncbi:hypothetical protein E1B28_011726 [Marasmius oreades]|uniref:Uncharacterized protein n=1 Tax=Marasmius oreades TaxID=181124 RepID=A0A9P7RVE2_9AGAR|nr:uncharacterized protein E1B28_011726 [Marasmius oreades]KAG7090115.1 hypothetical protein E1B28_011726 [Marasmius oreades]